MPESVVAAIVVDFFGQDDWEDQAGNIVQDQAGNDVQINGGIWEAIAEDVVQRTPQCTGRGIRGDGPDDRTASVGQCSFELRNDDESSGGVVGYYSIGHANVRTGWELGRKLRVGFTPSGGTTIYKYLGRIDSVKPVMGTYRNRRAKVVCKDFVDDTQKFTTTSQLGLLQDVLSNEAYGAILDALPRQPEARDLAIGIDNLGNVFHKTGGKDASAAEEINRIALSVLDYVYIEGDGTFKTQNRWDRLRDTTVQFTLDNTMLNMVVEWARADAIDKVKTTIYPTQEGTAEEIAYSLESPIRLNPEEIYELIANYIDPNTQDRVGIKNPVTPVANTHYKFGSADDGAANDLNDNLGIDQDARGGASVTTFTNNGEAVGFVNFYIIKGNLLRVIDKVENIVDVSTLQGNKELRMNLPYNDRVSFGENVGPMVKNVYGGDRAHVRSITYSPNRDAAHLGYFLNNDIGIRVKIIEDVTGISDEFFINGESWKWRNENYMECGYVTAPTRSGTTAVWGTSVWGSADWRISGG